MNFLKKSTLIIALMTLIVLIRPDPFTQPVALAQTPTASNFEVAGHVGGSIEAVFVQGDYAYIGQGTTLAVLDVSDDATPTLVGRTAPLSIFAEIVQVSGNYAYVADRDMGMSVIDISNPVKPVEVGFYPLPGIFKLQASGHYVYFAASYHVYNMPEYEGLYVLDVADPTQPVEIASYAAFYLRDFTIGGQYAYLVGGGHSYQESTASLRILDISHPNDLIEVGVYSTPSPYDPQKIALSANYAYIYVEGSVQRVWTGALLVVDIANPGAPAEVGLHQTELLDNDNMAISDNFLYSTGHYGLQVFDFSDPSMPVEAETSGIDWWVRDLQLINNRAYLASGFELTLLDISDPGQPTPISTFESTVTQPGVLAATNDYAYIADDDGLHIFDVTDPASPEMVNIFPLAEPINEIVLQGRYAYLATGLTDQYHSPSSGSLRILDLADPAAPLQVGGYQTPTYAAVDVVIAGHYAYLADEEALRIIDLANPANPVEVGTYRYWSEGLSMYTAVVVRGTYAYVAEHKHPFTTSTLRVVDISNSASPQEVGFLRRDMALGTLATIGNYVYSVRGGLQIVGSDAFLSSVGLSIIDVSNPEAPAYVGGPGYSGYSGVQVLDISDPGAPVETGYYPIPGSTRSTIGTYLATTNSYLYAAAGDAGLHILRHIGTPYIEGRITDPQGRPLAEVTVTGSLGESATTGADGTYTFEHVTPGAHILTPSLPNFTFEPPSRTMTVPPNAKGQDFTAQPVPVSTQLTLGSGAASLPASLTYTDPQGNAFDFAFPAGAVSQPTEIILTPIPRPTDDGPTHFKYAFELAALQNKQLDPGFPFNQPVTVSVHYNDDSLGGAADEAQLTLRWWTGDGWRDAAQTCDPGSTYIRDTEANTFQVAICHLSQFSPFEPETLSVCSQHVQVCPLDEASWLGEANAWQETGKKWQRDLNTPAGINVMWEWNNPYPGANALYADHRENPYADYTNTPDDVIVPGSHPIVFEWERWSETSDNYLLHQFGGDTESSSSFVGTTDCEDGIFFPVTDHTHPYAYTPMVVKHSNGDCTEGGYIAADLIDLWGTPLSQERMQRCDDPALGIPADQTPRGNALCKISPHVGVVFQHYARPANPAQAPNPIVGCEGAVYAWGWPEPNNPGGNTGQDYEVWFRNGELRLTRYHSLNTPTIPAPDDRGWWNPRCEQAWEQRTNWLYDGVYRIGQTIYTDTIALPIQETAVVPTTGGAITSTIDGTVLSFASDTFNDTVILTRTLLAQSDLPDDVSLWGTDMPAGSGSLQDVKALAGINRFYQLTAVYSATGQPAQPLKPYTVTIPYADGDIGPAAEATIGLYTWDGQLWLRETSSQVFTATNTLQARPQHFSLWGALGQTQQIYLPLVVK